MATLPTQHITLLQDDLSCLAEDVQTLESLGYQVSIAATPAEALLPEHRADIIVISVVPGNGQRQAEAGAALFKELDTPIVLLVGEEAVDELAEFDAAFFFDAVPRSANPLFLKRALQLAPKRASFRREHLQKEEHLQQALAGAQVGAWEWVVASGECYFSNEWAEMLGYNPTELEGKLSTWEALVHPDDLPASYAAIDSHFRGETEYYQNEHRLRCKDGGYKWILDRGKIVERGAAGQVLRVAGTHTDITGRKRVEEALRQSEAHFRMLIENTLLGYSYCQMLFENDIPQDFIYLDVNPAFERLSGLKDVIGKKRSEVSPDLHQSTPELFDIYLRVASSGKTEALEYYVETRKTWVAVSMYCPEPGYFIILFDVITDKKQAEIALRESGQKYHMLFEKSMDGILLTDPDGSIFAANPAACRILGKTEDEIVRGGRTGIINTADPRLVLALQERNRTGFFKGDLTFLRNDGTVFPVELTSVIERSISHKTRSHIIFRDISERIQRDAALRESEQKYRVLFDNQIFAVMICDQQTLRVLDVNEKFLQLYGFAREELLEGVTALDLAAKNQESTEALQRTIQRDSTFVPLSYHCRKDGSTFPVEIAGGPFSWQGRPVLFAIIHDISERFEAETKRKESEERYRLLFEHMQEGFALQEIITDELGRTIDFRILDANQAYEQHMGIKREDVIGHTLLEIQPNADLRQIERYGRVAQTGEPLMFEYYSRTYNRHLRVSAFSPKPGQFATVFEDISAMRKAESALRESEQKYRTLFENDVYSIAIFDPQTLRILDANDALVTLYGYGREELLSDLTILDLSGQEATSLGSIKQTVLTGSSFVPLRYHRKKDSSHFPVEVVGGTFVWQGRPVAFKIIHEISERVEAELKLKESEDRFRQVADTAPVLIWMSGTDAACHFFNTPWLTYTGRTMEQELGNGWTAGVHPDDLQGCMHTYLAAFNAQREFEMEYRLRRANGEYGILWDHGIPRFTSSGEFLGFIGSCVDITARVTAEEKLRASEAILSLAMDVAGLAPWDYDPSSEEFIFNDRFYSLYATDAQREGGYRIQTLDYVERFIHPDDRVMVEALTVCLPSGERNPNFAPYMEHRTVLPSGAERWVSVYTNAVFDPSGKLESMHGVNQDISERKRAEVAMRIANEKLIQQLDTIEQLQERLRDQAVHDALTELYNRHYLSEALAPEIIRSEREKTPLSVVIADVDHFKVINDTYGHPVGDLFLVEIADLMKKYVRGSDFVCRYGGEEFLLVFPGTTMRSAMKRAEEICQKCAEIVIQHEGKRLNVTLSFGVATYPEDGKTAEKVILRADQALYQSKHAGRNQVTGWINGQLAVHPENNEPQ